MTQREAMEGSLRRNQSCPHFDDVGFLFFTTVRKSVLWLKPLNLWYSVMVILENCYTKVGSFSNYFNGSDTKFKMIPLNTVELGLQF
jgi:hypothetical protein